MKNDQLNIASFNVQSFGRGAAGARKRRDIRDFFRRTKPRPDILLLQEHKFSLQECKQRTRSLDFLRGSAFWNEAQYSAAKDSFKGGTGILISPKISTMLVDHGTIVPGRVQFITLQFTKDIKVGILNIYAHNYTGSRAHLWNSIRHYNLPEAEWIMGGDFNMIETLEDKQGGAETTGRGESEIRAWTQLLIHLGLHDSFHLDEFRRVGQKKFTWDNRRNGAGMICSRLDRFYVTSTLADIGGLTGIWKGLAHISDHSPIFLKIRQTTVRILHTPAFNRQLLKNDAGKAILLTAWRDAMQANSQHTMNYRIFKAIEAVKITSDMETKRQRKEWQTEFEGEFEDVYSAEAELQDNWYSTEARTKLNAAQAELHRIRQGRLGRQYDKQASQWTTTGDRCNKDFFVQMNGQKKPVLIRELNDEGRLLSNQEDMKEYAAHYYRKLYTRDRQVDDNHTARQDCLRSVPRCVTPEQNARLTAPARDLELHTAIKDLAIGKAPGKDGVPIEFFQTMYEDISEDLLQLANEVIDTHTLIGLLNVSKIVLLPKQGDLTFLKNYRPISLLGSAYKIIAKLYANRIIDMLPHWIKHSQTAFVKGRCIFDNVLMAFEAMDWVEESHHEMIMLLLDFEKAYDRVSWPFLENTMRQMGFGDTWISMVMTLYKDATAMVSFNGELSPSFQLERSVR